MNFLPGLAAKVFGYLGGASASNPKITNSIGAVLGLASAWFGIDAATFASVGKSLCSIGSTLQNVPSF